MVAPVDVLVVGAGQAGLSAAWELCRRGLTCTVHERHAHVGDSWRKRYDSLVLFTSREYSALPDLAHAGDPDGFPHRLEMADYLERYAAHRALPVVTGDGDRGVTAIPGLFHVAREWQNSRASALICGVTHDAAKIAKRVVEFLRHS